MTVLTALYNTYLKCEESNLVDRVNDLELKKPVLLPIYHTNKRAATAKDIIEIILDEQGNFVSANYLEENSIIIFPITEDSITRTSSPAPHALVDELTYISPLFSEEKNNIYLRSLSNWVNFSPSNQFLVSIYQYLKQGTLVDDIVNYFYSDNTGYEAQKNKIIINRVDNKETLSAKTFITFKQFDRQQGSLTVSTNQKLHQDYINYVNNLLKNKEKSFCQISGEYMYCTDKHRGIIGNAKLISVSNNQETYKGRFKNKENVSSIGYESSQKIHNMLKYLMENTNTHKRLRNSNIFIMWSSKNIEQPDIDITGEQSLADILNSDIFIESEDQSFSNFNLDKYQPDEINFKQLQNFLDGWQINGSKDYSEEIFYSLIIHKVSNGRVAVKYFRRTAASDLYTNLQEWFKSTFWESGFIDEQIYRSPSFYQIVVATFGGEQGDKRISLKKDETYNKMFENLIPCIIDQRRLPLEMVQKMQLNLMQRQRYKNTWNYVLNIGCSVLKKYCYDYKNIERSGDLMENSQSLSYLYGRLAAIYEGIEYAVTDKKERGKKSLLIERYWSQMMQYPAQTNQILSEKIKPYELKLKKETGLYNRYNQMRTEVYDELLKSNSDFKQRNRTVNEDFIFGYYAQKKANYTKVIDKDNKEN